MERKICNISLLQKQHSIVNLETENITFLFTYVFIISSEKGGLHCLQKLDQSIYSFFHFGTH